MRQKQIVQTLFAQILQQTRGKRIRQIQVALGEIAELSPAQFERLWNELAKDTPLEQAPLQLRLLPAEVQCMACFKKYRPLNGEIHCPNCGSFGAKILSGEEIHVQQIETDEE
jgi:hydrogenase nickel incorporation protein HypA/HybF